MFLPIILLLFLTPPAVSNADVSDFGIDSIIAKAAFTYRLSPALIRAVIEAESSYDPDAKSLAGAEGLMQLMPKTGKAYGVEDPKNPVENIFAGARYLRYLLNRFKGQLSLAIAAYNAGEAKVLQHQGIPPFKETKDYVKRVLARYNKLQKEYYLQ